MIVKKIEKGETGVPALKLFRLLTRVNNMAFLP